MHECAAKVHMAVYKQTNKPVKILWENDFVLKKKHMLPSHSFRINVLLYPAYSLWEVHTFLQTLLRWDCHTEFILEFHVSVEEVEPNFRSQ